MAAPPGPKKSDSGKKSKSKGKSLSALYTISGTKAERKNRFCPKCGPGHFLRAHSNRLVCGKCQYVEFVKK